MTSQRRGLLSHHCEPERMPAGFFIYFFFHNNPAESMEREGRLFQQEALQVTLTCYDWQDVHQFTLSSVRMIGSIWVPPVTGDIP